MGLAACCGPGLGRTALCVAEASSDLLSSSLQLAHSQGSAQLEGRNRILIPDSTSQVSSPFPSLAIGKVDYTQSSPTRKAVCDLEGAAAPFHHHAVRSPIHSPVYKSSSTGRKEPIMPDRNARSRQTVHVAL